VIFSSRDFSNKPADLSGRIEHVSTAGKWDFSLRALKSLIFQALMLNAGVGTVVA
jgi:hypothetical protein